MGYCLPRHGGWPDEASLYYSPYHSAGIPQLKKHKRAKEASQAWRREARTRACRLKTPHCHLWSAQEADQAEPAVDADWTSLEQPEALERSAEAGTARHGNVRGLGQS
ncbi:hypothetical protein D9Q98_010107 [Chlorella vulgaris]|uniref:Uncharacterized protein n=1 Tax=Chlorella vulgaris TaxID=3077 RepID=A0A9D4TMW7_CHLVU|nr:hypothetical protein D9Q98_010107 [Chlorella vulgaris]